MNADTMLRNARAARRGSPTGISYHQMPTREVLVVWDRLNREYEVGTAASVHATGRRSVVLPVLELLLEEGL